MKNILSVLIITPLLGISQPVAPKNAKKIYVIINDSTSVAINKLALFFFEKGFTIENKDEKLGFISTNEKAHDIYSTKIRAIIKDTLVVFSSVMALDIDVGMHRTYDEVYNGWGLKKSPRKESWNELVQLASSFGKIVKFE